MAKVVQWPVPIEARGEGGAEGVDFSVSGLTCAECARQWEQSVRELDGVKAAHLNFASGKLTVRGLVKPRDVIRHAQRAGYQAAVVDATGKHLDGSLARPAARIWFLLLAAAFWVAGFVASQTGLTWPTLLLPLLPSTITLENALYVGAMFYGGYYPLKSALYGLWHRKLGANFAAVMVTAGALILGEWRDGAAVISLFALRELLLAEGLDGMRGIIRRMWRRLPERVIRIEGDRRDDVPLDEARPGDVLAVEPGQRLGTDGRIVQGACLLHETPISGAEAPVPKREGDGVCAGSAVTEGEIYVQVERAAKESALVEALRRVEAAQASPLPSLRWTERCSRFLSLIVMLAAVAVASVPPLILGKAIAPWLYSGLALLLLSLPCALAVCGPAVTMSAVNAAARNGLVVTSGEALEQLARVQVIAFDQTAAFTRARLKVTEVYPLEGWSKEEVLAVAAGVAWGLDDPIGEALVKAAIEAKTGVVTAESSEHVDGGAVEATVGETRYAVGSVAAMERRGTALTPVLVMLRALEREGRLIALVAEEYEPIAVVALAETIKDESARALCRLKRLPGVDSLVMLTDEDERIAAVKADELQVDEGRATSRTKDRVEVIRSFQRRGKKVAMVGDCEKDRTALAAADSGIALGPLTAVHRLGKADVLMVGNDLGKLPVSIAMARRAIKAGHRSAIMVVGIKVIALVTVGLGRLTLWQAALADLVAAVVVILGSVRLLGKIRIPAARNGAHGAKGS